MQFGTDCQLPTSRACESSWRVVQADAIERWNLWCVRDIWIDWFDGSGRRVNEDSGCSEEDFKKWIGRGMGNSFWNTPISKYSLWQCVHGERTDRKEQECQCWGRQSEPTTTEIQNSVVPKAALRLPIFAPRKGSQQTGKRQEYFHGKTGIPFKIGKANGNENMWLIVMSTHLLRASEAGDFFLNYHKMTGCLCMATKKAFLKIFPHTSTKRVPNNWM